MDPELRLTVLAVDDNRTNLQILRVFLNKLGHEVLLADNGAVALSVYREKKPDLILMDIMMPVMDGLEATRQIRAEASDTWVPIIFLSALDRDENLVGGLEAGGDDFLSKPINFSVLEAKMRSMARTLRLQQNVSDALRRLKTVSDNVLEAIVTIDTNATITSCNRAVEDIFGWEVEELLGKNVKILCAEPYRSEHDNYVREYVAGGPPRVIGTGREVLAQHRNGSTFPAELTISEVRLEQKRMFIGVIRDISERKRANDMLQENAKKLQRYFDATESENQLAKALIERQLMRKELDDPLVSYWISPAQNFSGDVLAAARSRDGRLYALLADATGHGLTAAISTLPLLTLFYRLVPDGAPLAMMISEINQQLRDALPVGRFVGATLLSIDPTQKRGEIWVGGMPNALLVGASGQIEREFRSQSLPMGILDSDEATYEAEIFEWKDASKVILYSDGMLEAENALGVQFGRNRLLSALVQVDMDTPCNVLKNALTTHLAGESAKDDISLLVLSCPTDWQACNKSEK